MGLFDFGTKAQIENLANHIGVGMQMIEQEMMKSSNQTTPTMRGIALGIIDDKDKIVVLMSSLTQSSREKLKVRYNNKKIPYLSFLHEMKRVADKTHAITGINFFTGTYR